MGHFLFLSHAGIDSDAALELAERIEASETAREHGLRVWVDKRDLAQGRPWQGQLERAIQTDSTAFAVLLGHNGVVNWVESEVRLALSRATANPDYPFIPLIDAESSGADALPGFAAQYQGIHYRDGDPQALTALIRAVLRLDRDSGVRIVSHPYKGLLTFETCDTHLFFGRQDETRALLELIRRQPLVMVIGDSGSGKSSLIKAGLIPGYLGGELDRETPERRYDRVYIAIQTRPLTNPFGALADDIEAVAEELRIPAAGISEIKRLVRQGSAEAVYDAVRRVTPDAAEILLFIDQFEELFTNVDPDERRRYVEMLVGLSEGPGKTRVRLVCTMRRDYYNLCSQYPDFSALTKQGQYSLRRIQEDQLEAIIRHPLAFTEVKDDPHFAKAVVADVDDHPGDLALLQLAITWAWDQRGQYASLTEAYAATGRVIGALAQLADRLYHQELNTDEQRLLEPLLIRMVRLGDTAGVTRRIVHREELSADTWALAQKLCSEAGYRLLKTGGDAEHPTIELSHEALVTQWPVYQGWLEQTKEDKRRHDDLMPRSLAWKMNNQSAEYLLTGNGLEQGRQLQTHRSDWLSPDEAKHIATSELAYRHTQLREQRKNRAIRGITIFAVTAAYSDEPEHPFRRKPNTFPTSSIAR